MNIQSLFIELDDYELNKTKIGKGTFGYIRTALNKKDGKQYVVRIYDFLDYSKAAQQASIIQEALIYNTLNHPAIEKLCGINLHSFDDPNALKPTFISEYYPKGSLNNILSAERQSMADIEWNYTKKLINLLGISHGMSYMHSKNIVHRNLKPSNILVDDHLYPIISDFRLVELCSKEEEMDEIMGTPLYMAPEIVKNEKYGPSVDVFSFSILAYEIVTGNEPYKEDGKFPRHFEFIRNVIAGERPTFSDEIKKPMKDLISKCWSEDPDERPSFSEIFDKISADYKSFAHESIDEDEIENYIDMLKSSEQSSG
ncbi:hypothetical protein M9Y10_003313 [Tritrichomonas musculus]|uniref:Protein kinase domain-containing protein n=1 Tax=Tritrichomonas musculus TaxID=1915356 RepID=A0ABR2JPG4_9EUKA